MMDVYSPKTLEEAIRLLDADPGLKVVAGGTDLIPRLNQRLESYDKLCYIRPYPETSGVRTEEDGRLFVGASVRLNETAEIPELAPYTALVSAATHVASYQIRNQATIGGNILQENRCMFFNNQVHWSDVNHCFKWGGNKCYQFPQSKVCMALFQSDVAPVLIAYGASVRVRGPEGEREIPAEKLYNSWNAKDPKNQKSLAHNEILTGILLPPAEEVGRSSYVRWTLRGTFDFPLLSCALAVRTEGDAVTRCGICFGAAGIRPQAFPAGADAFTGLALSELPAAAKGLHAEAAKRIQPFRDTHLDGNVRREKAGWLLEAAVAELLSPDNGKHTWFRGSAELMAPVE
ncbi:MAG: FAD binding domain-containing protein [Lachnospiraceae bacterium]|nr:FAD binding domain-containing protein [Lachnospiraceae bacterium]